MATNVPVNLLKPAIDTCYRYLLEYWDACAACYACNGRFFHQWDVGGRVDDFRQKYVFVGGGATDFRRKNMFLAAMHRCNPSWKAQARPWEDQARPREAWSKLGSGKSRPGPNSCKPSLERPEPSPGRYEPSPVGAEVWPFRSILQFLWQQGSKKVFLQNFDAY